MGSLEGHRIWVKELKNTVLTHVEVNYVFSCKNIVSVYKI